ncbi:hypothetical protein BZA77DRAFT_239435, partial [Pyronema omphalodes]
EDAHYKSSDSMIEQLDLHRSSVSLTSHQVRGFFQECRFMSWIMRREYISED